MYTAKWNGKVIAESDKTIEIEGNQYFPPDAIEMDCFEETGHHTSCPWKGLASYYNIKVDDSINENAAWYYAAPLEKAMHIKNYVAFWKGVQIAKR